MKRGHHIKQTRFVLYRNPKLPLEYPPEGEEAVWYLWGLFED